VSRIKREIVTSGIILSVFFLFFAVVFFTTGNLGKVKGTWKKHRYMWEIVISGIVLNRFYCVIFGRSYHLCFEYLLTSQHCGEQVFYLTTEKDCIAKNLAILSRSEINLQNLFSELTIRKFFTFCYLGCFL